MKKNKTIIQLLFFVFLLVISTYLLIKDIHYHTFKKILNNTNIYFIGIGLIISLIYVSMESIAFKLVFNVLNVKTKFIQLLRYSFIGFYFSAITPSSTGGQPAQIYYMKKNDIPISKSTLTLLLCIFAYQTSLILIFLMSFIFQYHYLIEIIQRIKPLLIFSITINFTMWLLFLILLFSKNMIKYLIIFTTKILNKFTKQPESAIDKLHHIIEDYHECAMIIKTHPQLLLKLILIHSTQLILRLSIGFFAAKALGLPTNNVVEFITIQTIILFTVAMLPLPGGIGISEHLYITLFTKLIPAKMINVAAITTQMMNYYFIVFIALIVVIYSHFKYQKKPYSS